MTQKSEDSIRSLLEQATDTLYRIEKRKELDRLLELYEKQCTEEHRPQEKALIREKIRQTEKKIEKFCLEGGERSWQE